MHFHESFEKVQIPRPRVLDGKYEEENDPGQNDKANKQANEQI